MLRLIIGMSIGAAWGFVFWYFGQCGTGVCVFTSNWQTTVTGGAAVGAIWAVWKERN